MHIQGFIRRDLNWLLKEGIVLYMPLFFSMKLYEHSGIGIQRRHAILLIQTITHANQSQDAMEGKCVN